jgi:DNA-directed RNA polymerase specialized sigma24 family protein
MTDRVIKAGSDEALMLRYAKGDLDAFQQLYEHHRGGLYRYFLRQSSASVAEELFQDVWARVIQSRKRCTRHPEPQTLSPKGKLQDLVIYARAQPAG